jgi:hypothetical protein
MMRSPQLEEYSEPELHSTRRRSKRIGSRRPFGLGGVVYRYYTNGDRVYARGLINLKVTKVKNIYMENRFGTDLISDG